MLPTGMSKYNSFSRKYNRLTGSVVANSSPSNEKAKVIGALIGAGAAGKGDLLLARVTSRLRTD